MIAFFLNKYNESSLRNTQFNQSNNASMTKKKASLILCYRPSDNLCTPLQTEKISQLTTPAHDTSSPHFFKLNSQSTYPIQFCSALPFITRILRAFLSIQNNYYARDDFKFYYTYFLIYISFSQHYISLRYKCPRYFLASRWWEVNSKVSRFKL